MRPAGGEHLRVRVALRDLLDAPAPFPCPLQVADPLAGVDQVAADHLHDADALDLARHRSGRRSIEPSHSHRDLAEGDEGEALEGDADHLVVDGGDLAGRGCADQGEVACGRRIVVAVQRAVAAEVRGDGVLGARRESLEQIDGALQPAVRLRGTAELTGVERELDGEARGRRVVAGAACEAVCALVRRERGSAVHLPPCRDSEALQRVDRLSLVERRLEVRARLGPRGSEEGRAAGCERALGRIAHGVQSTIVGAAVGAAQRMNARMRSKWRAARSSRRTHTKSRFAVPRSTPRSSSFESWNRSRQSAAHASRSPWSAWA